MNRAGRVRLRTADAEATRAVGAAIATHLVPGDVVALSGELGAGKTCLVQGAAGALDVAQRVTSPTFVLMKTYRGTVPLVHVDVYRLNRLQEVHDLGDDVFAPDVVTFVEWGDAIEAALPDDHLDVEVLLADPEDLDSTDRDVLLQGHGSWQDRVKAVVAACTGVVPLPGHEG